MKTKELVSGTFIISLMVAFPVLILVAVNEAMYGGPTLESELIKLGCFAYIFTGAIIAMSSTMVVRCEHSWRLTCRGNSKIYTHKVCRKCGKVKKL